MYIFSHPDLITAKKIYHSAKTFLQAGLADARLRLCSEPEAASIYIQSITTIFAKSDQPLVGTPYMVVDLGGILK